MTSLLAGFDLSKQTSINDVIHRIKLRFAVSESPPHSIKRMYLDTFDWRLFAAGMQLECEILGKVHTFTLRQGEQNHIIATVRGDKPARFAEDFPQSTVQKQLASIIDMRALFPVISLRCHIYELNVLNADEKTVLKIKLEENKLLKASGGRGVLLNRGVQLQPIRGYKKPLDSVTAFLRDDLQLTPSDQNAYTKALIRSKIQPGDYSSKPNIPLDPAMRADTAVKQILLHLLATMQANEQGTIDDADSEFLHDFRVACRRTRSAISQIKAVFSNKTVERYKREFAWLQTVTGPTRDLDVYLLKFDDYKNGVPEHFQNALQPLQDFLLGQQTVEQQKLADTLHTKRYQRLIDGWQKFLETPPSRASAANAARPIIDVASERIWKMYKRVIKEGKAINDQSHPEELHELRKSCKKLRYLLEFFTSLYPRDELSALIKALKQLQNNLGDYNDLHVQIASLEHYGKQMMEQDQPPAETFLAMGTLIESLDQKQLAVRREFEAQFRKFNAPQYHSLFRQLFAHPNTAHFNSADSINP